MTFILKNVCPALNVPAAMFILDELIYMKILDNTNSTVLLTKRNAKYLDFQIVKAL